MNRVDFVHNMKTFLGSAEFLNRKAVLEDNQYIDKKSNIVFARNISSLQEIEGFGPTTPVLFFANSPETKEKLTEVFSADKWDADRVNSISGEEFDYIYLHQCTLLGRKKDIPPFVSGRKKKSKKK